MRPPTRPDGSGALPLLAYSALYYPESGTRRRIRNGLERWAAETAPKVTERAALRILDSSQGTPIEPFELDDGDKWLAAILIRVTRGGAAGIPSIRIQGRDNLGVEGGLVVPKTGKPRFSERLATGSHIKPAAGTLVFRPGHFPGLNALHQLREARCTLEHSGRGIEIRLEPAPIRAKVRFQGDPPSDPPSEKLGIRGLEYEAWSDDGRVTLRAQTPEVILRLSALLANEKVVAVYDSDGRGRYRLLARLVSKDAEAHTLPAISSGPLSALDRWLDANSQTSMPAGFPSHRDRVQLSKWLAPPTTWLIDKLLEDLL